MFYMLVQISFMAHYGWEFLFFNLRNGLHYKRDFAIMTSTWKKFKILFSCLLMCFLNSFRLAKTCLSNNWSIKRCTLKHKEVVAEIQIDILGMKRYEMNEKFKWKLNLLRIIHRTINFSKSIFDLFFVSS